MTFVPKPWRDLPDQTTPIDAAALQDMESRLAAYADEAQSEAHAPLVSTLPSSPDDGTAVVFQNADMAALGVAWHLRYRAGATGHKWEAIGGGPFYLTDAGPYSTAGTGFSFAGSGQILVPLDGDYEVTFAGQLGSSGSGGVLNLYTLLAVNLAGTRLAFTVYGTSSISASDRVGFALGPAILTALAAGDTLRPRIKATGGNDTTLEAIDITARPVRVG